MGEYQNYNLESGITIKQEPTNENVMITSASVPIPLRRDHLEFRDYPFDLENSQSPIYGSIGKLSNPFPFIIYFVQYLCDSL